MATIRKTQEGSAAARAEMPLRRIVLMLCAVLAACNASKLQSYGTIDQSDRSITVPPGGGGLAGVLKDRLRQAGWRLSVSAAPLRMTGTLALVAGMSNGREMRTRYQLLVASDNVGVCIFDGHMVVYDLSVIDNTTGAEVITESGRECDESAADKVMRILDGKS